MNTKTLKSLDLAEHEQLIKRILESTLNKAAGMDLEELNQMLAELNEETAEE